MPRQSRADWSRPWSIDAPRSRRRLRLPRPSVLGLALAGAVALTPLTAGGGEGLSPLDDFTAAGGRTTIPSRPAEPGPRSVQLSPARPPSRSLAPESPYRLGGYGWPLPRGRLTQPFGPTSEASRLVDGRPFHDGIDLATFCGDRIVAAHSGRVLAAGRRFDHLIGYAGDLGRYFERLDRRKLWSTLPIVVVIDDGNGYRSMYAHFSKVVVRRGQWVRAGRLLGYEGATGNASGCHLHYGLFSPLETDTMAIRPDVARRWKLPRQELARIDPLVVLPERPMPGVRRPAHPMTLSRPAGSGAR